MAITTFRIRVGQQWYTVQVGNLNTSPIEVVVDGESFQVEVEGVPETALPRRARSRSSDRLAPTSLRSETLSSQSDDVIRSPMPGRVISIMVRPGEQVSTGQEVCVIEAMKMEQSIRVGRSGVVKTIHVQPMDSVSANDPLMDLE